MEGRLCTQKTLGIFLRPFFTIDTAIAPRRLPLRSLQSSRSFCATRTLNAPDRPSASPPKSIPNVETEDDTTDPANERPAWQAAKAAMKEKLNGEAWNPRKRLSPDTMEGIRHLHQTQPEKFTTPVLAEHFKVSSEAIRRILKSKWRPSDEEHEARMQRWDKRGERIWSNLVEMGIKPPKKWREMGVGRAQDGKKPVWKSRNRNQVEVRDSAPESFLPDEDILPTVDESGSSTRRPVIPLMERL